MGTFHILMDVNFMRSDIYQNKSAIHKNVFPYNEISSAPL